MDAAKTVLYLTAIFSALAALMAYLITYEEYTHHFTERRKVIRAALEAAVVAFLFFLGMGLLFVVILAV